MLYPNFRHRNGRLEGSDAGIITGGCSRCGHQDSQSIFLDNEVSTEITTQFLVCYVFYSLAAALSNIAFGPLSRYPGPKLRGAFHFPNVWDMIKGNVPQEWHALHEKYGEVVRISPDTISFINPEAWRGRLPW